MITKSTDLLAKLLAQENISVAHARVTTASFNIKTRVLTLPNWKNISDNVLDVFIFHEVGHALWTHEEYTNFLCEKVGEEMPNLKYKDYLNVIEDVRIERMIKRQFPGVRKMFTEGYKELVQSNFFGVPQVAFNTLNFIDRLNLYTKAGISTEITFTPEEKVYVDRAESVTTIKEVIELAKEVYDFCKKQLESQTAHEIKFDDDEEEESSDDIFDEESEEDEDYGMEYQEQEQGEPDNKSVGKKSSGESEEETQEEQLQSKTLNNLYKKLEESADDSVEYNYMKLQKFFYDPIITYKELLNFQIPFDTQEQCDFHKQYVQKFKANSTNVVNYLVKEFEMRKSAELYKRAQVSKTGSIDTRKLYAYKLKDDLFKRIMSTPEGKNHGMVMLLDWSGSMTHNIRETLEQVINLAMFCRSVQIPFEVFAFADTCASESYKKYMQSVKENELNRIKPEDNELGINRKMSLLQLFSSKMTNSEFNNMINEVLNRNFQYIYQMGSTPLNEAIMYMIEYLPKYRNINNIEKMTFITLTDGEGSPLHGFAARKYENGKTIKVNNFIYDEELKKNYEITNNENDQTKQLLQLLKDKTQATVLGFYLGQASSREIYSFIKSHYDIDQKEAYDSVEGYKKQIRDNTFASFKGTGRDDLFFVPTKNTKIVDTELVVDATKSSAVLARDLIKHLKVKKTSRILLSKFIDYVA